MTYIPLALILSLSFLLRVWGNNFGLPGFFFHTDETYSLMKGQNFFNLQVRGETGAVTIFHLYTYLLDLGVKFVGNLAGHQFGIIQFMLTARTISTLLSAGSVLLVYLISRKIFDNKTGLVAALFLGLTFIDIQVAHYFRQDPYMQFFGLLIFYSYLKNKRFLYLHLFLLGVLSSLRYSTLIYLVPILCVHFRTKSRIDFKQILFVGAGILITLTGFVIGHPSIFWEGTISSYARLYATFITKDSVNLVGSDNSNGVSSFSWWLSYMWSTGLGYLLSASFVVGIYYAIRNFLSGRADVKGRESSWFLKVSLLTLVIFWVALATRPVRFDRFAILITPFISIIAAYGFVKISELIMNRVIVLAVLLIICVPILVKVVVFDNQISRLDTREEAFKWLDDNFPDKKKMVFTVGDGIFIAHALQDIGYSNIDAMFDARMRSIFGFPGDLLVITSGTYQVGVNYPGESWYAIGANTRNELLANGALIKRFEKKWQFSPDRLENSATADIYHNPVVEIYKIPETDKATGFNFTYQPEAMRFWLTNAALTQKDGLDVIQFSGDETSSVVGPHTFVPRGKWRLSYLMKEVRCPLAPTFFGLRATPSGENKEFASTKWPCEKVKNLSKIELDFALENTQRLEFPLQIDKGISGLIEEAEIHKLAD